MHPTGTPDELIAAVGRQFHRDYGVVLRAVLFTVDRHRAPEVTGVTTGHLPGLRSRLTRRTQRHPLPIGVAALYCSTKIRNGQSHDRNWPLSWVGDTGIEPVTSSV
jgi:hypothetical protein